MQLGQPRQTRRLPGHSRGLFEGASSQQVAHWDLRLSHLAHAATASLFKPLLNLDTNSNHVLESRKDLNRTHLALHYRLSVFKGLNDWMRWQRLRRFDDAYDLRHHDPVSIRILTV